jgi:toxin FitB
VGDLLVDTDVFADHLRGTRELRAGDDSIAYSVITRAELFAGRAEREDEVDRLLGPFRELEVERDIAERAGQLHRETGVRLRDALIAATALRYRRTLVTGNGQAFASVPNLDVSEPATAAPSPSAPAESSR